MVLPLEEPIGSMLTAKAHVIRFCQCIRNLGTEGRRSHEKRQVQTQTHDIAGQSIDLVRHVCLGGTSVQILHKLREFMSETGHALESSSSGPCSTTSPTGRVRRCKTHVQFKGMKWLQTQQDSDPVIGVSVAQDRKIPGSTLKNGHISPG